MLKPAGCEWLAAAPGGVPQLQVFQLSSVAAAETLTAVNKALQ
jgi:hypothetical protein